MTKIIRFLCAAGLLATMLGSSALWSQDDAEQLEPEAQEASRLEAPISSEAAAPEAPVLADKQDESTKNKQPATVNEQPAGDFKPSEEISEDFPVPLPSDI